jgi:epoxyqueuosine reductase QueG
MNPVDLVELERLDEAAFRRRFRKTPLHRSGLGCLIRNAAILHGAPLE